MNGDIYRYNGDKQGIEVAHTRTCFLLSPIREHWPFPSAPVEVKKTECVLLRKHNHDVMDTEGVF